MFEAILPLLGSKGKGRVRLSLVRFDNEGIKNWKQLRHFCLLLLLLVKVGRKRAVGVRRNWSPKKESSFAIITQL